MTTCSRADAGAWFNYPFLTLKERDIETGLDYFGARYYSSAQGRFTSADEFTDLTDPQSINKYQYCLNNPLSYVDPDGHKPKAKDIWKDVRASASGGSDITGRIEGHGREKVYRITNPGDGLVYDIFNATNKLIYAAKGVSVPDLPALNAVTRKSLAAYNQASEELAMVAPMALTPMAEAAAPEIKFGRGSDQRRGRYRSRTIRWRRSRRSL